MSWCNLSLYEVLGLRREAACAGDSVGVQEISRAIDAAGPRDSFEISVDGEGAWTGEIRIAD